MPQSAATRSLDTAGTTGKPLAPGATGGAGVGPPGVDIGGQAELRWPRRIGRIWGGGILGSKISKNHDFLKFLDLRDLCSDLYAPGCIAKLLVCFLK